MPSCPQCTKALAEIEPVCPYCKADLDLLVEYVGQLQSGLEHAERLTRTGELGEAVWAYLAVLEVDPDNPVAQRQVGQVAAAVRQFDRTAPGRRWLGRARGELPEEGRSFGRRLWVYLALAAALVVLAFALGYFLGDANADGDTGAPAPKVDRPAPPTLGS